MEYIKRYRILLLLIIFASFFSCGDKKDSIGRKGVDIIRFERLIFSIDKDNLEKSFHLVKSKYPAITDIYFKNVLEMSGYETNDSLFYKELETFITDSSMVQLYDLCEKEFGEMEEIKSEFARVFERAKQLYPNIEIPRVYSYISGFVMQRFLFDDKDGMAIAFGVDMFLGNKFDYRRLERGQGTFSDYFIRTYNKEHLVKKVLELWLDDVIKDSDGERAIDKIVKNGKKLYIIKQLIPEIEDSVLLNYSKEQLEWLGNNEQELWTFMIKNDLFYTTNAYEIKRLISEAPNSQALGMPMKSPGQTGVYIGYKIVEAYMKRNKEKTIEDLIKDRNSQKIMSKSRFKPKRKS